MFRLQSVLVLLVLVVVARTPVNAEFPHDPKPCKYGDTTCIAKLIEYFVKEKSGGDASINLVSLDPLDLGDIHIKQGEESPVNIDLTFYKNLLFGLNSVHDVEVKGFGKDLTQQHSIRIKIDATHLVGDYKIDGKILQQPINGMGKNNITKVDLQYTIEFNGTPYKKDGATYMKVENLKLDISPEHMIYQFDNLFDGNKVLGDNANKFLNKNWKEIYSGVRMSIDANFGCIYEGIINNVFSKYPYEKFFTE